MWAPGLYRCGDANCLKSGGRGIRVRTRCEGELCRRAPVGRFRDRKDAGKFLGRMLSGYAGRTDVMVLGLARGGVPVAFEVAERIDTPLDVFWVRKLGVPGHEELAMGAVASGGVRVINEDVVQALAISQDAVDAVAEVESQELKRREELYRNQRLEPAVNGKTVILVDDGLATGATMRAAIAALRQRQPRSIVVAVPIAAASTCEEFRSVVDEIVCATTPAEFHAVGLWYDDFSQTTDAEIRDLLERAAARQHPAQQRLDQAS